MVLAIGKIDQSRGFNSARIMVLRYSLGNGVWSKDNLSQVFFPNGHVFLTHLQNFKMNDVIRFECSKRKRQNARNTDDSYVVDLNTQPRKCNRVYKLKMDDIYGQENPQAGPDDELSFFFYERDGREYICGPIHSSNCAPERDSDEDVPARMFVEANDIVDDKDAYYLIPSIQEFTRRQVSFVVDCMPLDQLKNWFYDQIKTVRLEGVDLERIQEIFQYADNSSDIITQRYNRIRDILQNLSLTWQNFQDIAENLKFKQILNKTIKENKEYFLNEYAKDLDELDKEKRGMETKIEKLKQDFEFEKERLSNKLVEEKKGKEAEFEKLRQDIEEKKKGLSNKLNEETEHTKKKIVELTETISAKRTEVENLEKKKNDIIDIIRVQAGIVNHPQTIPSAYATFPLEFVRRGNNAYKVTIDLQDKFYKTIEDIFQVPKEFLNAVLSPRKLKDVLHFCYKTEDIRAGIFLAHILGNSVYQLCQPSPKWISFKEFWQESLSNIWESAHNNPDVWHFLLIENFNIALPECWGYPLWNLGEGKTTLIPLAENPVRPKNLRIIVTKASCESEDNTHIGLPTQVDQKWRGGCNINLPPIPSKNQQDLWKDIWEKFTENTDALNKLNEGYYFPVE